MESNLKRLPFWEHLNEQERQLLAREAAVKRCPAGSQLFGTGDACLGLIHILEGELRAYILSREGREITLFRLKEGDTGVLSASCALSQIRFETHLAAQAESDILLKPSRVFGSLTEKNVYVRCFAYELATRRFSSVVAVMEQTLFFPLDKRLAGFLLSACRENGCPEVRMTQEELAARVNSVRETVGRMLKRFAAEGIIEIRRGAIRILDMEKLEKQTK